MLPVLCAASHSAAVRIEARSGFSKARVAERDELVEFDVLADARIDHRRGFAREVEMTLHQSRALGRFMNAKTSTAF